MVDQLIRLSARSHQRKPQVPAFDRLRQIPTLRGPVLVAVLAAMALTGIWIALGLSVFADRKAIFEGARAELRGDQKVLAAHVTRTYQAAQTVLAIVENEIVRMEGWTDDGKIELIALIEQLQELNDNPITVRLIDANGDVIEPGGAPAQSPPNVMGRKFIMDLAGQPPGTISIGAAFLGRSRGIHVLPVAVKARPNKLGVVYVAGGLRVDYFSDIYEGLLTSAPAQVGVVRSDGVILATWPWDESLAGARVPDSFGSVTSDAPGEGVVLAPALTGGGRSLVGYSRVESEPLMVFAALSVSSLTDKWVQQIIPSIVLAALSSIVVLLFAKRTMALIRANTIETQRAREAMQRAEVANIAKKDFLANMSHELRTPLNGIIGFAELMEKEVLGPLEGRYKNYVTMIATSGRNLLEIVKEILDVARIEAGIIDLQENVVVDVEAETRSCVLAIQSRLQAKDISIVFHFGPDLPRLKIGRAHLKQVLGNIIGNAVKFSNQKGRVAISGQCVRGEDFLIQVMDNGIGIPKEKIESLFTPFTQIAKSDQRGHGGLGLGLSASQRIAQAYGGEIVIKSDAGRGTTVFIVFPARLAVFGEVGGEMARSSLRSPGGSAVAP